MSRPSVLMPLARGAEEMEAVIVADVLVRAGARVAIRGLDSDRVVTASRGIGLVHEGEIDAGEDADAIYLPGGGEGAQRLGQDARVHELLRRFEADDRWIAAICAAPSVLALAGVCAGKRMTSHPSVRAAVEAHAGSYAEDAVVVDGKLITGRGPGVAFEFALTLVSALFGPDVVEEVCRPMMFGYP